jgi:outer membrane immunogenic protein
VLYFGDGIFAGIALWLLYADSQIAAAKKASDQSKQLEVEREMKKFLLGTVGLVALGMAAPAVAADLPARTYTKAPAPVVAAIYDWSGFYIGGNGGYGTSRKEWDATVGLVLDEGSHDATGGVAGGQIGYRWQSGAWVFGLEAQGDWADLRGSNVSLLTATTTNRSRIDAFGLFTGQIGYTWNNVLWYAKGGAAVTSDKYAGLTTATGVAFDAASETRWGAVVGTGLEFGFTPNWSFAFEYDHIFNGDRNVALTSVATGALSRVDTIKQDVDLFTVRLNYRWGGPVIAKY